MGLHTGGYIGQRTVSYVYLHGDEDHGNPDGSAEFLRGWKLMLRSSNGMGKILYSIFAEM